MKFAVTAALVVAASAEMMDNRKMSAASARMTDTNEMSH